jgi:hypothetical protein
MWSVSASDKGSDVRPSIASQFTAAALTAPSDRTRASAASLIDGILAAQCPSLPITVNVSGRQGVSHPDNGAQNNVTVSIVHQGGSLI